MQVLYRACFVRCYARVNNNSRGRWREDVEIIVIRYFVISVMNRSSVALDDDRIRRDLPSICRPLAWERRRPYSANYPLNYHLDDDIRSSRSRLYHQHGQHVTQRSRDDLFYQRPSVDSTRHLLEVKLSTLSYIAAKVQKSKCVRSIHLSSTPFSLLLLPSPCPISPFSFLCRFRPPSFFLPIFRFCRFPFTLPKSSYGSGSTVSFSSRVSSRGYQGVFVHFKLRNCA